METNTTMKKKYLAVYDYGMGGVWLFMYARSSGEIIKMYPELTVVDEPPVGLDKKHLDIIATNRTFDIDEAPTGWLLSLVEGRQKK